MELPEVRAQCPHRRVLGEMSVGNSRCGVKNRHALNTCLRDESKLTILGVFSPLVGSVSMGEPGLKMWPTEVSCNSQLYSEHQAIYLLRVKRSHVSKVYSHKNNLHVMVKVIRDKNMPFHRSRSTSNNSHL